jgi:hypothetical protein
MREFGRMNRHTEKPATAPAAHALAISIPEVVLVACYFLAVSLIPVAWLDSAPGAVAFALAGKINPYLSDYSIAFARKPDYFIHCHVLATWMIAPGIYPLIVRRNGGARAYAGVIRQTLEKFGGVTAYIVLASMFFAVLYFAMIFLVDFPLTRAEWAIWGSGGVAYSAFMYAAVLSLWAGSLWMAVYAHRSASRAEARVARRNNRN